MYYRTMNPSTSTAMRILVFGIALLIATGIASLVPALPLLADEFDIPLADSWGIIAAFALPGFICIPIAGALADRIGRKRVLLPALALFALGGVACVLAQSYTQLLVFRFVQGVGASAFALMYTTLIADTWQGHERLTMMSRSSVVLGIGTAASPAVGGALAMLDWRLPFLLSLAALPLIFLALRLPLLNPGASSSFRASAGAYLASVRDRHTLALLGLTLLTFIMLSGPLLTCFPILAEQKFQATPLETGLILALASLAAGLAAFGLPKLYRRYSTRALLLTVTALYIIGFISISLVPALWLLAPAVLLYGLAQGLNIPLVSTLLADRAGDSERTSLLALNGILLRLGQIIGPAIFGTLAGWASPSFALAAGSVPAVLMIWLIMAQGLQLSAKAQHSTAEYV